MKITAENLGKRFNYNWVFRKLNFTLNQGESIAIIGPNGSGKSTLLQILAGVIPPSEGAMSYTLDEKIISPESFYNYLSISTPYLELIEEFTFMELLDFHFHFKKMSSGITKEEILRRTLLEKASNREIRFFSSGMKQRVKLALAFFSDTPILFLDEPTSNLDKTGIDWYLREMQQQIAQRAIFIASNQGYEYDFCQNKLDISHFA